MDQVYLSCWIGGFTGHNMLASYGKVLDQFPLSRLAPVAILRVLAIDTTEPPVAEYRFDGEIAADGILAVCREHENPDCAYEVETWWDLWQGQPRWKLAPSRIAITLFGPLFPSNLGSLAAIRSNIRSLLHFSDDIREAVQVDKLTVWSDSGESLVDRLRETLE